MRNTRLTLGIAGPEVLNGWRTSGVVETDFFGGFTGTGPFSDEQPGPRLRLAYADLVKGGTTLTGFDRSANQIAPSVLFAF